MRTLGFQTVNPFSQLVMWAYGLIKHRRSVWNPGICRPFDEALALGLIEPRIAPLVERLNVKKVVSTFACCEGHGLKELPYIGLKADIGFIAKLNQKLVAASPVSSGQLHYHWIVEYGQCFVLCPHIPLEFNRANVDQDIQVIGKIVEAVIEEYKTTE